MARNQTGLSITVKAFLPFSKNLNDQLAALTLAKEAHESGDYSALIAAAQVDDVKVEQKSRRVEDAPAAPAEAEPAPLLDAMQVERSANEDVAHGGGSLGTEAPEEEVPAAFTSRRGRQAEAAE